MGDTHLYAAYLNPKSPFADCRAEIWIEEIGERGIFDWDRDRWIEPGEVFALVDLHERCDVNWDRTMPCWTEGKPDREQFRGIETIN